MTTNYFNDHKNIEQLLDLYIKMHFKIFNTIGQLNNEINKEFRKAISP